jgi:hypothetical protein
MEKMGVSSLDVVNNMASSLPFSGNYALSMIKLALDRGNFGACSR